MQRDSSLTCSLVSATGPYLQPVKSRHILAPCFCKIIIIIIIIHIYLEVAEGVSFIPGFDLKLSIDVQFLYVYVDISYLFIICLLSDSDLHKAEWCDVW